VSPGVSGCDARDTPDVNLGWPGALPNDIDVTLMLFVWVRFGGRRRPWGGSED
jgi:hypothetical protein